MWHPMGADAVRRQDAPKGKRLKFNIFEKLRGPEKTAAVSVCRLSQYCGLSGPGFPPEKNFLMHFGEWAS